MGSLPNLQNLPAEALRPAACRPRPWDDCALELRTCQSPRVCVHHRPSLSSSGASSVRRLIASVIAAPPVCTPAFPRRRLLRNNAALCLGQVSLAGSAVPLLSLWAWRVPMLAALLAAASALSSAAGPALVRRLGAARVLLAGHAASAVFLAVHLLPVPPTPVAALVPAYLLQGAVVAPMNVARAAQLWGLAACGGPREVMPTPSVTSAPTPTLRAAVAASQDAGLMVGSALAAALLAWAVPQDPSPTDAVCGASACPPPESLSEPAGCGVVPLLAAALLGFAVAGCALAAVCLDRMPPPPTPATRSPLPLVLAASTPPLALFVGLGQAFIIADFSRWYTACILSLPGISLSFVALGALRCIASLTLNLVLPHICRLLAIGVGAAFHSCLLLVLVLWQPSSDDSALFFVIAAAWGVCDSIWETVALTSSLMSQGELWPEWMAWWDMFRSLGQALAFVLHPVLCVQVKLYILAAMLVLGVPPYVWMEIQNGAKISGL